MNSLKPLLIRDNRHSQIVFFLMTIALFMISGTVALYIKEAVWGFGVLIFLTGLLVLSIARGTNKLLPRFFAAEDKAFKFVYWNGTEKVVPFSDIQAAEADGEVGKSVTTVLNLKTKNETIKVLSEVFDSTAVLINCLQNITEIEYKNKIHERAVKEALNASSSAKKFRLAFAYFWVSIFLVIAAAISLNLPSMIH